MDGVSDFDLGGPEGEGKGRKGWETENVDMGVGCGEIRARPTWNFILFAPCVPVAEISSKMSAPPLAFI